MSSAPQLTGLHIADAPERWEALGFEVRESVVSLGGVALRLGAEGSGIVAWTIDGLQGEIDGLRSAPGPGRTEASEHPNGAIGIDHVVVLTPDFARTAAALDSAGLSLRRVRDAGGFRQGFRRLGPAILELVEGRGLAADAPAVFWGLVVVVGDLAGLAARLGPELLNEIHPAVQSGREIATLRATSGVSPKVAFMTPES